MATGTRLYVGNLSFQTSDMECTGILPINERSRERTPLERNAARKERRAPALRRGGPDLASIVPGPATRGVT
jgi:hypothetical protein